MSDTLTADEQAERDQENAVAEDRIRANDAQQARLDDLEQQLDALPPSDDTSNWRAELRRAIAAKRQNLIRQNRLWREYLESDDEDRREDILDEIEDLVEEYRDTEDFSEGSDEDTCVPCTLEEEIWEIVEVQPVPSRRQYINIDREISPAQTPPEHHRRNIRVTARIAPARRNKTIYWQLHAASGNRRAHYSESDEDLPSSHQAELSAASSRTNGSGIARVILTMGQYGGDKFQVSASREPPRGAPGGTVELAPLRTGVFEVWRKLWYAVVEMNRPTGGGKFEVPAASLTLVRDAYEKVWVEFIDTTERGTGAFVENFESNSAGYRWADSETQPTYIPWKVVYSAVHFCVPRSDREEREREWVQQSMVYTDTMDFRAWIFNGEDWLISGTAEDADGNEVTLDRTHITLTNATPYEMTQLKVDLSSTGLVPSATNPVEVEIEVAHAPGYNGWGGANLHLVICRGAMEIGYGTGPGLETAMGGTSTHEPGHALGLVRDLEWETDDDEHSAHCAEYACVLWWQGYSGRPTDFHGQGYAPTAVNCHTYLRGRPMDRDNMEIWDFPR